MNWKNSQRVKVQWNRSVWYIFKEVIIISDVKRLIKYERQQKVPTAENVPRASPQVIHAPENVINVTIIKEVSPKKSDPTPTASKSVGKSDGQAQTDEPEKDIEEPVKQTKRLLRLPRHVRTKNPKVIYKKGIVSGVKNGVLIRNTPTDLYQKYQDDWIKFKSYIPGENSRLSVRRSVRKKMQQKENADATVRTSFGAKIMPMTLDDAWHLKFNELLFANQLSSRLTTYKVMELRTFCFFRFAGLCPFPRWNWRPLDAEIVFKLDFDESWTHSSRKQIDVNTILSFNYFSCWSKPIPV